ncbi:uncharacterized protein LOC101863740 [Aplysia californica]|uniref:Uncharacterized protein LOC101863740 n=1 Tax=Aplysia californica TaxID=6500 RepID=A0ABM0JM72_APLCA|nr:uncharacterized protein LOC101863740 [Aplysia californica]
MADQLGRDIPTDGLIDTLYKKINFWSTDPSDKLETGPPMNPASTCGYTTRSACAGGRCGRVATPRPQNVKKPLCGFTGDNAKSYGSCRPCSRAGTCSDNVSSGNFVPPTSCPREAPASSARYCSRSILPPRSCENSGSKDSSSWKSNASTNASMAISRNTTSRCNRNPNDTGKSSQCSLSACQAARAKHKEGSVPRGQNFKDNGTRPASTDHREIRLGKTVLVSTPADRHDLRAGEHHFWGVVMYVTDDNQFKIGTRKGTIGRLLESSELRPAASEKLSVKDVPNKTITFREACSMSF